MDITLTVNGVPRRLSVAPNETLMRVLRREGYFSVKHGCEDGTCGVCTVLVNGEPRCSCITLAAQVDGAEILTVEGLSGPQMRGWKGSAPLHPIQRAFIETGAFQSGYEAPALILAAKALLDRNPNPTEEEVRDALSGVLSRETGYVKPVQAVLRAAAYLRGEEPPPLETAEEAVPMPPELMAPPPDAPPEARRRRPDGPADRRPPPPGGGPHGGGTAGGGKAGAEGGRPETGPGQARLRRRHPHARHALCENPPQPSPPRPHPAHRREQGARPPWRPRRPHLPGHPPRRLLHRGAVGPHPRPPGLRQPGSQGPLRGRPGGGGGGGDPRNRRGGPPAD